MYPVVELLGQAVTLFNPLKNCQAVFQVAAPFYVPTSMCEGSSFSTSSPTLVIVCLFFFGRPRGMQDLSSPTRDRTRALCSGSVES